MPTWQNLRPLAICLRARHFIKAILSVASCAYLIAGVGAGVCEQLCHLRLERGRSTGHHSVHREYHTQKKHARLPNQYMRKLPLILLLGVWIMIFRVLRPPPSLLLFSEVPQTIARNCIRSFGIPRKSTKQKRGTNSQSPPPRINNTVMNPPRAGGQRAGVRFTVSGVGRIPQGATGRSPRDPTGESSMVSPTVPLGGT